MKRPKLFCGGACVCLSRLSCYFDPQVVATDSHQRQNTGGGDDDSESHVAASTNGAAATAMEEALIPKPEEVLPTVTHAGNVFFGVALRIEDHTTGSRLLADAKDSTAGDGSGGHTPSSSDSMPFRLLLTQRRSVWIAAFDNALISMVGVVAHAGRIVGHPSLVKCVALRCVALHWWGLVVLMALDGHCVVWRGGTDTTWTPQVLTDATAGSTWHGAPF